MNEDSDTKYSEFNIKLLESKYALIYGNMYIHTELYNFIFLFCYSVNLQVGATLYLVSILSTFYEILCKINIRIDIFIDKFRDIVWSFNAETTC